MRTRTIATRVALAAVVAALGAGCGRVGDPNGPPANAVTITVSANSAAGPWLSEAALRFGKASIKTKAGRPVWPVISVVEAGQSIGDWQAAGGTPASAMWVPDSEVWVELANGRKIAAFKDDCVSLATSPLVIGMWRPLAEALGYPARTLGWLDMSSLAADSSAWAYYSGGQFGKTMRLAHTHPGLSGSGASTLLAIAQAAKQQNQAVSPADIKTAILQASVTAFEGGVALFAPATDGLGATMRERGIEYLGAAVMYESTVATYGSRDKEDDIVPIYPFEGSFVATHPGCVNNAVSAEAQEAARLFRDWLLKDEGQKLAAAAGLRPVNKAVKIGEPLASAPGIDLSQPKILFAAPIAASLDAVQELWKSARKPVNLTMILDTSGSMAGTKIDGMRVAAETFLQQMNNEDYLTLITFSTGISVRIQNKKVKDARADAVSVVRGLKADGNTALYDAIAEGAAQIKRSTSPFRTNVMIVLTDGQDTSSKSYKYDANLVKLASANSTSLYTVAYGKDADNNILGGLARQSNGNFYQGTEANIAAIYQDLSTAFGGSGGIGR